MKGTVKQAHTGNPNNPNLKPNKYTIKGEDGKEYIAHIGDIQKNEEKLYQLDKEGNTIKLKENDPVEFEPETRAHAIHVRIIKE